MKECLLTLSTAFIITVSFANTQGKESQISSLPQNEDTAYTRVITERAAKIVVTLGLPDSAAFYRVRETIAGQYRALNNIDNNRDARIKQAKEQSGTDKAALDSAKKHIGDETDTQIANLHAQFLSRLGKELTPQQVDKVKDGLTYGVLPLTYHAYQDELPNLTDAQKTQILTWLTEAREYAMDAGSSKEKHAWFGKYKGRINNYLSKEGYDMKKAEADWMQRIKDRKASGG